MSERSSHHNKKEKNGYLFIMSPYKNNNDVYYKNHLQVNFKPEFKEIQEQTYTSQTYKQKNNKKSKKQTKKVSRSQSITPTFNQDYKYYSPCFKIPLDFDHNDSDILYSHNVKVKESILEIPLQDILIPKPRSKSLYCAVCKIHYQDYLQHIECTHHKKSIKRSQFNQQIQKLFKMIKQEVHEQQQCGVITRSKYKSQKPSIHSQLDQKYIKKRKIITKAAKVSYKTQDTYNDNHTCLTTRRQTYQNKSSINQYKIK